MTVDDLIAALTALPPEQRALPLAYSDDWYGYTEDRVTTRVRFEPIEVDGAACLRVELAGD